MHILIIEDEYRTATDLQETIREILPDAQFSGPLDSVEASVKWFETHPTPDLAFFDIQLADGLSFDIFEETRVECPVIFCTAFDEHAMRAFQVNSVDYILKPFERESVRRALEKVRNLENFFQKKEDKPDVKLLRLLEELKQPAGKSSFLVTQRDKMVPIAVAEVAYFYIEHELTFLHTFDNRRFMLNYTLDELEKLLDRRQFYRANRQYLVNAQAIVEVEHYFARKLLLKLSAQSKEQIIVSKAKASEFLQWMENR